MGEAVRNSGLGREEVFLTTKILSAGGGVERTLGKLRESVGKIDAGTGDKKGYVDLFLIHSPSGGPEARKEMWQALERLLDEGGARSIGVSNFGVGHIEEMREWAKVWPPHVNQIEVSDICRSVSLLDVCRKSAITPPLVWSSRLELKSNLVSRPSGQRPHWH